MKKRKTEPWMTAADYGRTLGGLSVNLIVRDVARSVPFYTRVLGLTALYSDADFAALEAPGVRLQLHADHTYERMPWAPRLRETGKRGLGAEIRILGIDPEDAERRARDGGFTVLVATRDWPHGWRDCVLEDPDGYTFAVGTPLPA
ncbi:MAG TPA: VOC family protein [Candidatus Limnocylindria bacterium]|jgi:catechol 2,3-dioxygenase-like lactoylglutathione lyase family enzyme|nr:VOC family protein [Candidatus Limnocylindria bacterium]